MAESIRLFSAKWDRQMYGILRTYALKSLIKCRLRSTVSDVFISRSSLAIMLRNLLFLKCCTLTLILLKSNDIVQEHLWNNVFSLSKIFVEFVEIFSTKIIFNNLYTSASAFVLIKIYDVVQIRVFVKLNRYSSYCAPESIEYWLLTCPHSSSFWVSTKTLQSYR